MPTVVIFVDSRSRDLMGDALIAHHLEKKGARCILEPLESWRACIGAWKPDFLLFNHLSAPHLATYSQQLREWGILCGVLPNEGIFFVDGDLEYNSIPQYPDIHCDRFLAWNNVHRNCLIENNFCPADDCVVTVGVPRFDFYKKPWRSLFETERPESERPRILINTNFSIAHYHDLPDEDGDRFFALWKDKIPVYADYRNAINTSWRSREHFPQFVHALLEAEKYEIFVRPHPREDPRRYLNWFDSMPEEQKSHIHLAAKENITELILSCDVQVSCENCTTTLEAWLADKPTIGLVFEKHPFFYSPEACTLHPECDQPEKLAGMIEEALADPSQPTFREGRRAYIEKWMDKADGCRAEYTAQVIIDAIENRDRPKNIRLDFSNKRRGLKLRLLHAINEPINFRLKHFVKRHLFGDRGNQTIRYRDYMKAIRPSEVAEARRQIARAEKGA